MNIIEDTLLLSKLKILQKSFLPVADKRGIRNVIMIPNEREGGCPFKCKGCGVHNEIVIVKSKENREMTNLQIQRLSEEIKNDKEKYLKGHHICFYNNGNLLNPEEFSKDNLYYLLDLVNNLDILPSYISIETRGCFINEKLLNEINKKKLKYDIHFILGVETFIGDQKIYGKKDINKELNQVYSITNKINNLEDKNTINWGIDANFIFLPEFYTKDRNNVDKIRNGFIEDVNYFLDCFTGKNTPTKINIHPFYKVDSLPFESVTKEFDLLFEALTIILELIKQKKYDKKIKPDFFIGINDSGYENSKWKNILEKYDKKIKKFNLENKM